MEMNEWSTMLIALTATIVLSIIGSTNGAASSAEHSGERYYYVCPPEFVRYGSKCYYFSTKKETWQNAYFSCKDQDSNLTVPFRWEDRNLRDHLNRPESVKEEYWIGGMYDWKAQAWKWGGEMREMNYQSFQRVRHLSPEKLAWHCIAMVPEFEFRWDARSCLEKKLYICQSALQRVKKNERDMLRRKWKTNGNGYSPNEIRAPKTIHNPPVNRQNRTRTRYPRPRNRTNNVGTTGNELPVYRPRGRFNGRRKPVPENILDSRNNTIMPNSTEGNSPRANLMAYKHNLEALRSGRTGLTQQQINRHIRRLERLREQELRRLRRTQQRREQSNRQRNAGLTSDPNKLAQGPSNVRSREIKKNPKPRNKKKQRELKHYTYSETNELSELHPKQIVEVHDFTV